MPFCLLGEAICLRIEFNGLNILGCPIGSPSFCKAHASKRVEEEQEFLKFIPKVATVNLQCAWLLLLYCAVPRANHIIRVLPPSISSRYAELHDTSMFDCLLEVLSVPRDSLDSISLQRLKDWASLPCRMGAMGLRSARRIAPAAHVVGHHSGGGLLHVSKTSVTEVFQTSARRIAPAAHAARAVRARSCSPVAGPRARPGRAGPGLAETPCPRPPGARRNAVPLVRGPKGQRRAPSHRR